MTPHRHPWGHPCAQWCALWATYPSADRRIGCSLLAVGRGDGTSFCRIPIASEDRISGLNGDLDWNRTRIDGISRARAWSGLGIFNHNLVKIP